MNRMIQRRVNARWKNVVIFIPAMIVGIMAYTGDLVTDAEERLSRPEDIDTVRVDDLHGIAPKLSATVITVGITVRWTTTMTDAQVRRRLAEVPGLESIERIG